MDSIICGYQGTSLLRRLAYVQLMRLFKSVEAVVKSERQKGLHQFVGYGNTSVAIDIYISAQESSPGPKSRSEIVEQRGRIGNRAVAMSGPSPLFLLIYSHTAESILYVVYTLFVIRLTCLEMTLERASRLYA